MLVVARFAVPEPEAGDFAADAEALLDLLAARPGWRSGRVGRAADDPGRWVLVLEWEGAGHWRRALSSYDVRMLGTPLLSRAEDEPSAYEVHAARG